MVHFTSLQRGNVHGASSCHLQASPASKIRYDHFASKVRLLAV
jgi:hypothetical protein